MKKGRLTDPMIPCPQLGRAESAGSTVPSPATGRPIMAPMPRMSPALRRALFGHWTHYLAGLPFNLNWAIRPSPEEAAFLAGHPMVVCDVGARGQAPEELLSLFPYTVYYAFDADAAEAGRIQAQPHPYAERTVSARYVGGGPGPTAFHLYAERGRSSAYRPSERHLAAFGDAAAFRLDDTVELPSESLDRIVAEEHLRAPDFLKLDTQGSELEILRHATRTLASAHLVEVEVEFTQMYAGQPLFGDVAGFLAGEGYELLYLNRAFMQRKQIYRGPARGQITFGDALFGRREDRLEGASDESLIKYVLLLVNYGHRDFALQIIEGHPRILEGLPSLTRHFTAEDHGSNLRRVLVSQGDKLAMLWLHARRYNRFNNDSDRSWPIR